MALETDSLPIPPLDPLFFSSDLPFKLDDNYDFDLTFDDLDDLISDPLNDATWSSESALSNVDTYLKPSPSSSDSSNEISEANEKESWKRKKENSETEESVKVRKSENVEEEKRIARLIRNRESAQLSRERKKHYVEELEDKVRMLNSQITDMVGKMNYLMAENASLRHQMSGSSSAAPPMYMPYPWLPCPPYPLKPQGSQVPLVPIPRLKPAQPPSKTRKTGQTKKGDSKVKKLASVAFFGFLFFVLLFGGLVPAVDFNFGGVSESGKSVGFVDERVYGQGGSIVNRPLNGTNCNAGGRKGCSEYDVGGTENLCHFGNGSEPLVASLYVPRNDKLVKIDGNLIIHSVLASEKAMASRDDSEKEKTLEKGLAIPTGAVVIPDVVRNRARHSHSYETSTERKKALTSGRTDNLKDQAKPSVSEGKLQQWFHEGLAGPLLSSGLCSEVFQFDTSPTPGAIVAAPTVSNVTSGRQENATRVNKGKSRRILRGIPIPLARSNLNISGEHRGKQSQKENFQGNKSGSPMVVSVLLDPREAGDGDVDGGVMKPKSLSRIFVVVLMDSVKYVTYSCVLPRAGPQLVTT